MAYPNIITTTIQVIISPAGAPAQTLNNNNLITVNTVPIEINISRPLIESAYNFLQLATNNYIDEDRQLKTLLNYGEDKQSVALAYRYGSTDENGIPKIQLKLLQPVPDDLDVDSTVFLSREVTKTLIDKVRMRFAPELDTTPYLRPKNLAVKADLDTGKSIQNMTLTRLSLQSGSVGITDQYQNKTFEDEIFRQWYSYDFNSSELNIDFTDYNNFIFYSSAAMRLEVFQQKLYQLQALETKRNQFLSTYTSNTTSVGLVYVQDQSATFAKEKEDIIRGFDRYEQFLYFTTGSANMPYTASAYYADDAQEYNSVAYWPKSGSEIWPVSSSTAINWYTTQSLIAQRFDEFNENNLINTIPVHIREDENSDTYITFISMVGHFFDTIKPFVDQLPQMYDRDLNPNKGLSKDLINEVAQSFGFTLPTLNSIYNLADNIIGTESKIPRRDMTAEIYKRLLHNLPFFAKAKGTKTALDALIKTFGITPQLIRVQETSAPTTSSYNVIDEFTVGLDFDELTSSYIRLPLSASARTPTTLQFTCIPAKNKTMTVMTGDSTWALNVAVHPTISKLGRIEITSGSSNVLLLSSSYQEIFDENINITVQNYASTSSLYVTHTEGEDLVFQSITTNPMFSPIWNDTQYVYMGGFGARVVSNYEGILDEMRIWNDSLSDEVILHSAFDPGSNAGDTYSAPVDHLLVYLSFKQFAGNSTGTSTFVSLPNETPYKNVSVTPSLKVLVASNIKESSFIRYNRTIREQVILAGSRSNMSNKVKVADAPVFISTDQNNKRLYRTQSIVAPNTKKLQVGRNKIILSMSPTEIINQNIIRNFGLENINAILGSPTTLYTQFDKSLNTLKQHYQQYHYIRVNINRFIRIVSDLGSVLDQVLDYFIPSKATLLKGIVIEPNILEQVKIPPVKNMRVYGKNTKKTNNAANSLTGSRADYGATFNVSDTIDATEATTVKSVYSTYQRQEDFVISPVILGSMNRFASSSLTVVQTPIANYFTYNNRHEAWNYDSIESTSSPKTGSAKPSRPTTIDVMPSIESTINSYTSSIKIDVTNINSAYATYNIRHEEWSFSRTGSNIPTRPSNIDLELNDMNKIPYNDVNNGSVGAEPYNRIYTRKLFDTEIDLTRNGGITSMYIPALYDIPPSADFRDLGVYTYFNNDDGVYLFPEITKTPSYPRPLNATWNDVSQSFENAVTWSYGGKYNINDVVYQSVDNNYTQISDVLKYAKGGNDRYYVFTTRPAYSPTTDGTAFYSGSVPSYTPPSLDRENWEPLRFKPVQKRLPKRIVFDTYTVSNPALNNFKTTTISVNKIINIPDRYIDTFSIPSIPALDYVTGELVVQNLSILFALQSSVAGLRVRLYRTPEDRDADINRTDETRPENSHGVLVDLPVTTTNTTEITNPYPTLIADSSPPAGKIFYTINNTDDIVKSSPTLLLYYFAVEIENRVPTGYLRKHYRFFRDNSTATKRRNYVGCKNTIDTTIDGLPPIQVFLSEGTDLVVSPTTTNTEIVTGGGGTLDTL